MVFNENTEILGLGVSHIKEREREFFLFLVEAVATLAILFTMQA